MYNSKQEFKVGAILSYVNLGIGSIIPLLYTPIMLKLLGDSEYGLYSLSASVIGYLSLLTFGFGSTIVRYITMYRASGEKEKEENIFGFFLVLYSIIAVVVIVVGMILSSNVYYIFNKGLTNIELDKMKSLVLIMSLNTAISLPNSVYIALSMAHEKYIFRRIMDILFTVLTPIFNLIVLYLGGKAIGLAIVGIMLQLIMCPVNIIYSIKKLKIYPKIVRIPIKLVREMIIYSFFVFLDSVCDMLFWSTDKVILGMLASTTAITIYNMGSVFNTIVTGLSASVSNLLIPRVTTMIIEGNNEKQLTDLFIRIGRIQYYVVGLVVSGFIVFGQQFIALWVGESYLKAYWIALFTMVPLCVPLIQNTGLSIVMAQNKHQFRSVCYLIIAVINVVSTYLVVPYLGEFGAAMCSGIAYILGQGIIMNIFYYKKIKIDIPLFWKNIIKLSIIPILMTIVGYYSISSIINMTWLSFCLLVIIYSCIYFILIYVFEMNSSEKQIVNSFLKK